MVVSRLGKAAAWGAGTDVVEDWVWVVAVAAAWVEEAVWAAEVGAASRAKD